MLIIIALILCSENGEKLNIVLYKLFVYAVLSKAYIIPHLQTREYYELPIVKPLQEIIIISYTHLRKALEFIHR